MGQAASLGLTQYDVDELIAYAKGACEWWAGGVGAGMLWGQPPQPAAVH